MSDHHKLSLRSAVLVNLNIMVGFGIFINTVLLSKIAGFLGFLCYAFVAILILPLIMSVAALIRLHPSGGFYSYSEQEISPFAGFLSSWIYFTGKLASASLIIHVVMTLVQQLIPFFSTIPILLLDIVVISLFTFLNTLHMKVGSQVAGAFFTLKLTPILFALLSGLYLLSTATIPPGSLLWSGIPSSIPFVLYAFTGFEATCSLSRSIENAEINGPKAIYYSFALAIMINIVYQFLFFATTHGLLMSKENYLEAFPVLLGTLLPEHPLIAQKIVGLLHLALATAALGGSYGILFSNHWNLYALAQHKHTFFTHYLTQLNKHNIPTLCVMVQAGLCFLYLCITQGSQVPLQQINALACTLAYSFSVVALIKAQQKINASSWIPYCALLSCSIFFISCLRNFVIQGATAFFVFALIVGIGVVMYGLTRKKWQTTQ